MYAIWEAYPWRFGEPYCLFKTFLTEMTTTHEIKTCSDCEVQQDVTYEQRHFRCR